MSLEYRILGWRICQGGTPTSSKASKVFERETFGLGLATTSPD
jgi:hypothetical protein